MTLLLAVVGVAAGFVLGVWFARRGPHEPESAGTGPSPASEPERDYAVVERHRDGVVVADPSGRIVYRNAAARELQGTHIGVLVGETIDRHIRRALAAGRSDEVLELFGPPRVVLVVDATVFDGGGVVVFVDDISEQRRTERMRTDFVANISHEIKTPVGAMSVLAETLEDETDPGTIARIVERMMSEAHRATRTIDDLMELSHIEVGREREFEPVRAADVVVGAMERVTELASRREIGLSHLASADQLDGVEMCGDRRQLVSALGNLVENAVKYSEPGAQVKVRTQLVDGAVEFAVIDQGVGIPRRDLDRIFERFYRVDGARSRDTGGSGLGLAIVRHVANNHDGDVWAESTEGEGSVFTLRLPALVDDDDGGAERVVDAADEADRGIA